MLEFAQKLIDEDVVTNVEALEKLAGQAVAQGQEGPAPQRIPSSRPTTWSRTSSPCRQEGGRRARRPIFAFEDVDTMDDKALGAALKVLLGDCVRYGASDLHLCTGRRPFVRKDRVISYISEHPLSADEALRLNTVLLTPEQKKAFLAKKDLDYALAVGAWTSATA